MSSSIVHIGYHKTATSWFQKRYYPQVANATYIGRRRAKRAFLNTGALHFDPGRARRELEAERPIIVCEEALCGPYETAGLLGCLSKDVAYRIYKTLPDARIVVFIRNQPAMLAAIYLQYIRRGGTASVRRFLFPYRGDRRYRQKRFKKPMFSLDHFDYRPLIQLYRHLFGPARVHVFAFEAFQRDPGAFLAGYGRRLGLEIALDRVNFAPRNRSYRSATLGAARVLNRFAGGDALYRRPWLTLMPQEVRQGLLEAWNRGPFKGRPLTPATLLGPTTVRTIRAHFAESNRQLALELDLPLGEYGYPVGEEW